MPEQEDAVLERRHQQVGVEDCRERCHQQAEAADYRAGREHRVAADYRVDQGRLIVQAQIRWYLPL